MSRRRARQRIATVEGGNAKSCCPRPQLNPSSIAARSREPKSIANGSPSVQVSFTSTDDESQNAAMKNTARFIAVENRSNQQIDRRESAYPQCGRAIRTRGQAGRAIPPAQADGVLHSPLPLDRWPRPVWSICLLLPADEARPVFRDPPNEASTEPAPA